MSNLEVMYSSKTDQWATPTWLVDLVHEFRPIDLDPCTMTHNPTRAARFFTDGALSRDWYSEGLVYINPPYGRALGGDIDPQKNTGWAKKISMSRVQCLEQIILVPARTDTRWFQDYLVGVDKVSLVFLKGRLRFGDSKSGAPFPSVLMYHGPNHSSFFDHFWHLGLSTTL